MKTSLILGVTGLFATGCGNAFSSEEVCGFDAFAQGAIIQNHEVSAGTPLPVPLPIVIVETTQTNVPIISVTATAEDQTVLTAQLVNPTLRRWQLDAYPLDLEHFRGPDGFTATIHFVGTSLCGEMTDTFDFDTAQIVLGPRPNKPIGNVQLAFLDPLASCTFPVDVPQKVQVTADADGQGASVIVSALHGVLENGQTSLTVLLKPSDSGVASDPFTFTPNAVGKGSLTAFSAGASANEPLTVSGPPTAMVTTGSNSIARGVTTFIDVSTLDVLSKCYVAESSPRTTTLSYVKDGTLQPYADSELSTTCGAKTETLALSFNDLAPDGATALIRCSDPYGRAVSASVPVANRPAQSVPVTDLNLKFDTLPDSCYVPADGQTVPLVLLDANLASAGGTVTLSASHGAWPNGQPTTNVVLAASGSQASGSALFLPTSAGVATVVASANGSSVQSKSITIAPPPSATPAASSVQRGATAFVDFDTRGRFERCVVEPTDAATVNVLALDPATGPVVDEVTIPHPVGDCTAAHHARFSVVFGGGAPTGASVTVRCYEVAYGRSVAAVVNVAN